MRGDAVGRWGGQRRGRGIFCEDFAGGQGYVKVDLERWRLRELTVGRRFDRECPMEEFG